MKGARAPLVPVPNRIILYVHTHTHSNLTWRSSSGPESLVLEYPSIALHAVSRDSTVFSQHCVYLQYLLLHDESEEEEEEREEEEEKEKDDPPSVIEYRFVPASSEKRQ